MAATRRISVRLAGKEYPMTIPQAEEEKYRRAARIKDFDYGFRCTAGTIESNLQGAVFSVSPDGEGAIELEMATGR